MCPPLISPEVPACIGTDPPRRDAGAPSLGPSRSETDLDLDRRSSSICAKITARAAAKGRRVHQKWPRSASSGSYSGFLGGDFPQVLDQHMGCRVWIVQQRGRIRESHVRSLAHSIDRGQRFQAIVDSGRESAPDGAGCARLPTMRCDVRRISIVAAGPSQNLLCVR